MARDSAAMSVVCGGGLSKDGPRETFEAAMEGRDGMARKRQGTRRRGEEVAQRYGWRS